ncbi:MAG: hypothetical protein CBC25_03335 [Pelagibacteraceae bacterium TMED65]|nr:MAG: hypothetical protein CBC25_03335 [Pelagibacteraceae bacterium TMED65]|tara:strand:- start:1290 stop:1625 length:336 start_codon:yes stop_codon:yes gene_type:complete
MAVYSNLTVDQGTDFTASVDVTDTDGDALNLTGFTVAGQVRRSYYSSSATNLTCAVSNATSGIITVSLSATQSDAMKPGRYVYDVEITNSGGTKTRVLEGQLEIMPGVTKV